MSMKRSVEKKDKNKNSLRFSNTNSSTSEQSSELREPSSPEQNGHNFEQIEDNKNGEREGKLKDSRKKSFQNSKLNSYFVFISIRNLFYPCFIGINSII